MRDKLVKKILLDVMDLSGDCCAVCKKYGQILPECKCMVNTDCVNHLIKLAKKAVKSEKVGLHR